jgi:hypothetical protein
MPWEHRSEPLAPSHVFAGRVLRQILLVAGIIAVALAIGTTGYILISDLDLGGAGPLYTERSSSNDLKIFSSLYALFSTLIVVSSVGILASPVVHRVLHRLHLERGQE